MTGIETGCCSKFEFALVVGNLGWVRRNAQKSGRMIAAFADILKTDGRRIGLSA
jgi:hypothetical protein